METVRGLSAARSGELNCSRPHEPSANHARFRTLARIERGLVPSPPACVRSINTHAYQSVALHIGMCVLNMAGLSHHKHGEWPPQCCPRIHSATPCPFLDLRQSARPGARDYEAIRHYERRCVPASDVESDLRVADPCAQGGAKRQKSASTARRPTGRRPATLSWQTRSVFIIFTSGAHNGSRPPNA
jgi:hypothetical protein